MAGIHSLPSYAAALEPWDQKRRLGKTPKRQTWCASPMWDGRGGEAGETHGAPMGLPTLIRHP